MKIKKNGKVITLTESDIKKITNNMLNEQMGTSTGVSEPKSVVDDMKNHSEWIKYLNSRIDDMFKAITRVKK